METKKVKNKFIRDNSVYYRTSTGRYKPFGVECRNYLSDGIWYVRNRQGSSSMTNVEYMAELFHMNTPNMPIEIDKVCALEDAVDYVQNNKEYQDFIKSYSYSLNDLIHIITKLLFEKYGNIKD